MSSRALPVTALVVLVTLTALVGCAGRDGLRVEGTAAPAPAAGTTTATPSPTPTASRRGPPATTPTEPPTVTPSRPTVRIEREPARSVRLGPGQLRALLLADPAVDPDAKAMLAVCREKCLTRGVATDLVGRGSPQRVVTVNLPANGFVFTAYLVGDDAADTPSVLSVIRGDDMRITAGRRRTLVVESKVFGQADPICCPSGSKVEIYRWSGNHLVRTSEVFKKGS